MKPADRYASPKALADDIEHWLADEPVTAYREPLRTRAARWGRKHEELCVAGAFGLVTAAAIALAISTALIQARSRQCSKAACLVLHRSRRQRTGAWRTGTGFGNSWPGLPGGGWRQEIGLRRSVCALLGAWQSTCESRLVHAGKVTAVAFSPDGTKLATASEDNSARLWDVATGQPLGPPMEHDNEVKAVAFSPDGTKVVTASWDKTARLWDAATGRPLGPPMRHEREVQSVVFSPDGTKVVTAAGGGGYTVTDNHNGERTIVPSFGEARLWDAATGQPLGAPMKHDNEVNSVAFSPDGTKVVSASADKTARLWDAATGQPGRADEA